MMMMMMMMVVVVVVVVVVEVVVIVIIIIIIPNSPSKDSNQNHLSTITLLMYWKVFTENYFPAVV